MTENLKEILEYIPYFESDKSKYTITHPKEVDMLLVGGYYLYDETLEEFIDTIYRLNITDNNYLSNHKKIEGKYSNKSEIDIIRIADLEEILTLITFYIRGERFCSGMLADACDKKIFLEMLLRIKCLLESNVD